MLQPRSYSFLAAKDLPAVTSISYLLYLGLVFDIYYYREVILTPIQKKSDFNTEDLKNCRPISSLSYVSKLNEKVVARQMTNYVSTNNLDGPMRCAY